MRIRLVMDCLFTICSSREPVQAAVRKMAQEKQPYLVVVDDKNKYRGVLMAVDILTGAAGTDATVETLVRSIAPVQENDPIALLKKADSDFIPVVNQDQNVVGIINLKSLLEYLPEVLADGGKSRTFTFDRHLSSKYTIDDIIGQSREILQLKEKIIAAAKTKSTVLILGETGTGKELVAHAIHRLSDRRHQPFVRMNCATIPENLLESELFGYEPGAFTGAIKGGHAGKFETADGGAIFLDEIGDMPQALQAKILRVLQEKEVEKIGSRAPVPVDVRVIAATHCNLLELVQTGKFRQDLYYRLHVIPVYVPPLRDRREDIVLLVDFFSAKFTAELGVERPRIERQLLTDMLDYDWPGNVRELANVLEAAISMSGGIITREHWQRPPFSGDLRPTERSEDGSLLRFHADEAEREAIVSAIKQYRGNKIKISEALGISRSSLYNKLRKYNIDLN